MSLKELNCTQVTKLQDIQNEGDYIDPTGDHNPYDRKLVSCLQTHYKTKSGSIEEYNELQYIIDEHFQDKRNDPSLYKALCECCKEKENNRFSADRLKNLLSTERNRFIECVNEKLRYRLLSGLRR